ncbi:MAG TPA: SPFH domain-containing protein [Planctomycetota bacterium]|nr:SPFH domain-containing protein [Planctomycetota bacterium]
MTERVLSAPADLPLAVQRAARWQALLAVCAWSTLTLGIAVALAAPIIHLLGATTLAKALALPGAALLVAAAALLPALVLVSARSRVFEAADAALVARRQRQAAAAARAADAPATQVLFGEGDDPDLLVEAERARVLRLAGWPQAAIALPIASVAVLLAFCGWPGFGVVPGGFGLGIALLLVAFPVLVVERRLTLVAAQPGAAAASDLPEAAGLSRVLRLLLWTLVVAGAAEVARALGATVVVWVLDVQGALVIAVAVELALRVAVSPFLPAASLAEARGLADSAIAGLVLPRLGGGAVPGAELKERFGIDLSQSWALGFVRRASLPLAAGLLVIGWLLSGVTTLSLQERGVYERLGAPIAVFKSGLHFHLPWPFGVVRRVESGAVHELAIGLMKDATGVEPAPLPRITADYTDTRAFDRVWRFDHAADALYIVPGEAVDVTSRAAQVLNSDVRVFYRIGLDDAAARASLYGLVMPEDSVRLAARRQLARVFSTRPLMAAIGADREQLGAAVRVELQKDLDAGGSGLEVIAVTIDSIHPPAKAAAAYHGVQEASIIAAREVATARRDATVVMSEKTVEGIVTRANASAQAFIQVAGARVDTTLFNADAEAWRIAPQALALERWLQVLRKGLSSAQLDIIDHRLRLVDGPVLDMRRFAAPGDTGQ